MPRANPSIMRKGRSTRPNRNMRFAVAASRARSPSAMAPTRRSTSTALYSAYPEFDFVVPTCEEGDSMARYLVRMEEMAQSLRIIEQGLDKLPAGPVMAEKVPRVLKLPAGDYCYAVEAARGRFAVRIVSDGKEIPYRVKLRTPSLSNLSLRSEE